MNATQVARVPSNYLTFVADPAIRSFCGPLFFTASLQSPVDNVLCDGSFGLVDTGKRKLLVTCHHVLTEFRKSRDSDPSLVLGLSLDMGKPIAINPEDYLVDEERRCDLVTFDMDSIPVGNLQFFNIYANRPPKVNVGDVLYLIGFPGKGRIEESTRIGFPRQAFGVHATQVGQSSFFSDCANLKLNVDDVAGISGCPCFVISEYKPIRLVGFATGFSEVGNLLQFTYANYIQPDGTIQYMA